MIFHNELTINSTVSLSDKSQYKYFFRTIPTQIIFADTMLAYVAKQGWSKVSILYSDDALGQQCKLLAKPCHT